MVRPENGKRISKTDTYLNCAEVFAYRSTCIKRKYGAVIVKDDVVISTGYNGAPRGFDNCCDLGKCPRTERDMHQGDGYGMCRAVQNWSGYKKSTFNHRRSLRRDTNVLFICHGY